MAIKHSGEPNIFKSGQYENDYFPPKNLHVNFHILKIIAVACFHRGLASVLYIPVIYMCSIYFIVFCIIINSFLHLGSPLLLKRFPHTERSHSLKNK